MRRRFVRSVRMALAQCSTTLVAGSAAASAAASIAAFFVVAIAACSSSALAHESISPPYLWHPTNDPALIRLIVCGSKKDPGGRIFVYRNMSHRFFTSSKPSELRYDVPLGVSVENLEDERSRMVFLRKDKDGRATTFAEIVIAPGRSPIRLFTDLASKRVVEIKCKSYRFDAEFVQRRW